MKKSLHILFGLILVFSISVNFSFSENLDEENETVKNCDEFEFITLFDVNGDEIISYCLIDVLNAAPASKSSVTEENGNLEIEEFDNIDEYPTITSELQRLLIGIEALNAQVSSSIENDEAFIEIMIYVKEPTSVKPLPDYVQIRYEIEKMVQALVPIDKIYELDSDPNVSSLGTVERPQEYGIQKENNSKSTDILSPKQQLKDGTFPEKIICKEKLELIFKSTDNSPVCVKPQTAEKLIARGWGILILNIN